ncbi:hypothetical protein DSO57_1001952 [Entomophthora muscae]|uniref:Uncharacterized protein n=1 Tax=Entomophthora muscae TaxID=34485 RepID=A0ACC2UUT8_9FUNG|nr:hypothetical protein DSO57_1001952 [Entomophthora muscae]
MKGFLKRYTFLEGIVVRSLDGECQVLSDLWRDQVVILKVLRRFGCPLCRYESRLLSDLKPYFDELNVRLVGVGFEEVGLQEFMDGKYWEWDLFLDPSRSVHSALRLETMGLLQGLRDVASLATRMATAAASRMGLIEELGGDGFQLGGTFIITPTRGVVYEYRQVGTGTFPSIKDIIAIVGGDPDLVNEYSPEECLFDAKAGMQSPEGDVPVWLSDESDFEFND